MTGAGDGSARRGLDRPLIGAIRARPEESVPAHGDEDVISIHLASAP